MLKVHIRRTLIAAIIAGLFGLFVAVQSKKIYEAPVEMLVGSPQIMTDQTMPDAVKRLVLPQVLTDIDSDTGMLKSARMFQEGLKGASAELAKPDLMPEKAFQELYPMFDIDIPGSLNQYAPTQQRVVRIRVRAYSPDDAASIANHVALAFSDFKKKRASDGVRDGLDLVVASAKKAKTKLNAIDNEYKNLKVQYNMADTNEHNRNLEQLLQSSRSRRNQLDSDLASAQAEYDSLSTALSRMKDNEASSSSTMEDPVLVGYRQLEAGAQSELEDLKTKYLDDSPLVVAAQAKYNKLHQQRVNAEKNSKMVRSSSVTTISALKQDMKSKVAVAKSRIDSLRNSIAPINASILKYEQEIQTMPQVESKFFDLQRNRLVQEEEYQKNQKWVEELTNVKDGSGSQIQSLADAKFITDPVAPDAKKYVILAAIVGALIGLAYSFAIESFKLPVHTSWQLAELTALPVAASVPMMPKPLARRHYSEIKDSSFKPIESFRYMAFSMMAKESRPQVLLFAGVGEDVDSSGSAAEFAVSLAKTGARTVLVDCDLRLPRLSEMFGVQGRSGVAEVLGRTILPGESTDLFVSTAHENLSILPAGAASPSGLSDFLTSHMMGLIEDLREKADTVVINCPPVDVFADASRLAQYVDETCLVISAKTTSYRAIPVAQEILTKSGAKAMSIVLTNASPTEEPFGARSGVTTVRR